MFYNGGDWTIAGVISRATAVASGGAEVLMGTCNDGSGGAIGLSVVQTCNTGGTFLHHTFMVDTRSPSFNSLNAVKFMTNPAQTTPIGAQCDKHVFLVTADAQNQQEGEIGSFTGSWFAMSANRQAMSNNVNYYRNGKLRSGVSTGGNLYGTSNANGPMRLFASTTGANPSKTRLYEIVIWNRALRDREIYDYMEYARNAYHLTY